MLLYSGTAAVRRPVDRVSIELAFVKMVNGRAVHPKTGQPFIRMEISASYETNSAFITHTLMISEQEMHLMLAMFPDSYNSKTDIETFATQLELKGNLMTYLRLKIFRMFSVGKEQELLRILDIDTERRWDIVHNIANYGAFIRGEPTV